MITSDHKVFGVPLLAVCMPPVEHVAQFQLKTTLLSVYLPIIYLIVYFFIFTAVGIKEYLVTEHVLNLPRDLALSVTKLALM